MKTLENNKLIAEFMGAKYCKDVTFNLNDSDLWLPYHGICNYKRIDLGGGKILKYHTSWDWLIPVIEKIESLGYFTEICHTVLGTDTRQGILNWCEITKENHRNLLKSDCYNVIVRGEGSTKIESVYNATISFIKWYNNQNK